MGSMAELARLLPWFEERRLEPVVGEIREFDELPAAGELLAARQVFGKVVVAVTADARSVPRPFAPTAAAASAEESVSATPTAAAGDAREDAERTLTVPADSILP
jgi:hypothetical protein